MHINRIYLKDKILETANEKNIMNAVKKLEKQYNIPYYTLYNFTRRTIPNEQCLLKIIKCLNLDVNILFNTLE